MRLAIVVRSRDRAESLLRCLRSVEAQVEAPRRCEIIVLDDGSRDGTSARVKEWFASVASRGFGRLELARNERPVQIAASAAQAMDLVSPGVDWILSIDDDAELAQGALVAMLETAGGRPGAAIVGPRVVDAAHPEKAAFGARYVGAWTGLYREKFADETTECDWVTTTCCLLNAKAYREAGGFPADFRMSHWEVDLCLRVRALGGRVYFEPRALVRHEGPPDLRRPERAYYLYRNKGLVIGRNFKGARRLTARAVYAGPSFAAAVLRAAIGRHPMAIVMQGFADGLAGRAGPMYRRADGVPPPAPPFVSIAVITKDRPDSLKACVASVLEQGHPAPKLELVVVDDGSMPENAKAVLALVDGWRKLGLRRIEVYANERSKNVAGARALALALTSRDADWILSIDDDATLAPGALAALLEAGRDPSVGLVGPKIVYKSRPDEVFAGPYYVGRWTGFYTSFEPRDATPCDWLSTTCLLVRGSALRQVPFAAEYHTCHEDVDFGLGVRQAGWTVLYDPAAVVLHDFEPGLLRPGRAYYLFRNKALLIRRRLQPPGRWVALALYALPGFAVALARAVASGRPSPADVIRGHLDGLAGKTGPA